MYSVRLEEQVCLCLPWTSLLTGSARLCCRVLQIISNTLVAEMRSMRWPCIVAGLLKKACLRTRVYAGISDLLCSWAESGRRMFLATSKPAVYARQIVEHFELSRFLDHSYAVSWMVPIPTRLICCSTSLSRRNWTITMRHDW